MPHIRLLLHTMTAVLDRNRQRLERQRAEAALRRSEEQYRLLVHNLPGIVYRGYRDWTVDFFDQKIQLLTGYPLEEFTSRSRKWSEVIAPQDFESVKQAFIQALKTDRRFVREYRIRTSTGELLWIQDRGSIVCDEQGRIEHVDGVFFDISERKKLEEKVARYQLQLRSLASELSQAEEQAKRQLAVDLHDSLAQSLAIAKLKLEMLGQYMPSPDLEQTVEEVRHLVNEAILQTRYQISELSPPGLYEFGLHAGLEELARRKGDKYGIRVVFSGDNCPEVPENLRALLYKGAQELLLNVVKHAQARTAWLAVHREAGGVRIEVADDGTGFRAEELGPREDGTGGFGLFSLRERLSHFGGSLEIDSAPGAGTRAVMVAPLKRYPGEDDADVHSGNHRR